MPWNRDGKVASDENQWPRAFKLPCAGGLPGQLLTHSDVLVALLMGLLSPVFVGVA